MNYLARDFFGFNNRFDRLFDSFLPEGAESAWSYAPAYATGETTTHFWISLDVPGVAKEDVKIEVTEDELVVTGERKGDGQASAFQRTFRLNVPVDAGRIEAVHKDGVLRIALPKSEAAKPKLIPIRDEEKGGFFERFTGRKKEAEAKEVH